MKNYSATSQTAVEYGPAVKGAGLVESVYEEWKSKRSVRLWRRVF